MQELLSVWQKEGDSFYLHHRRVEMDVWALGGWSFVALEFSGLGFDVD